MKAGDKVKVLSSPYEIFTAGEIYTISYEDDRPYGVYLLDPFYEDTEVLDFKSWPFHLDELELIK